MPPEPDRPPQDDAFLHLVAEALERLEHGGEAALEELCRAHPGQAEALRSQVARLRAFGLAGAAPALGDVPERLGPFRLLARLGGGGMGVVYVAEQEGLGRRVALKLVRPEHLYFEGARERFRREVEALARLQHEGIVPVYAGGEEKGVPYLAMELVRGATLDEVLAALRDREPSRLAGADLAAAVQDVVARREGASDSAARPTPTPTPRASTRLYAGSWGTACVRIAQRVAEALAHAHAQGVLHRDVKPGNVMLTPEGRVLLVDFGLAAAEGSARLTGTGQPLGSPAYMSPEQLRGGALDGRTDVYSLGVTLYEALTLRQPFAAPGLEATRQRALAGRPPAPRELNPAVSRDAETVVLAAMEPEAARRYASAAALAADLSNVLELRPVQARRAGAVLRARRWAQRHPARATALAALALLLLGGPLAWGVTQQRAAARIRLALDQTSEQRARAEANFARARGAVDELLLAVSEEELRDVPHLEPLRRRLLEAALRYFEEFLAERGDDPALRRDAATAGARTATLLNDLGRTDEALAAARRAGALAGELLAAAPGDVALLAVLGDAQQAEAHALVQAARLGEASAAAAIAVTTRRARLERLPDDPAAHHDLDAALGLWAVAAVRDGRIEEAAQAWAELADFNERVAERFAGRPDTALRALGSLVVALSNRGDALAQLGRADEARAALERGVAASEPRLDELAADAAGGMAAGGVRLRAGQLLSALGEDAGAEGLLRAALAVLERTEAVAPNGAELQRLSAGAWNSLGVLLMRAPGREAEAREALLRSVDVQRRLVALAPGTPVYALNLGGSLVNVAAQLRDGGDAPSARPLLAEALDLLEGVRARDGGSAPARNAAFLAAWHLALACLDLGDAPGAADAAERLLAGSPGEARPARIAAGLLARAAAAGDPADAAERLGAAQSALQAALDAGYADAGNLESASDLAALRAREGFPTLVERARANGALAP